MSYFYCETCGQKYTSIASLTAGKCKNNPAGAFKGNHKLYEGTEKHKYSCKLCGNSYSTIAELTSGKCKNHPNGPFKGNHQPAL